LYYTDDSEDKGKLIRNKLSEFEQDYDVDKYSLAGYFDRINKETRIQIQQGSADESVPKTWSDALYEKLSALNLDIDYFVYPGADHNLQPSWKTAIQRDLEFFMSNAI
jgi:predicted esterase